MAEPCEPIGLCGGKLYGDPDLRTERAGKSTLGRALASRLGCEFIDSEDLYFPKEDPAYEYAAPRSKEEAVRILEEKIRNRRSFVFAAVKGDYGDKLISALDAAVLVDVPREIRIPRVKDRSFRKFGGRISPGGDLFEKEHRWFALVESRPDDDVTRWLETVKCPVIRVDGTLPVEDNVNDLLTVFR